MFRGPSGSGKSDIALRLIDNGARLIADDRTKLVRQGDALIASAPDAISGQIEVRGVGVLPIDYSNRAPLSLVFDLVPSEQIERYPDFGSCRYLDVDVPLLLLAPFEASAPAKVRMALQRIESEDQWGKSAK